MRRAQRGFTLPEVIVAFAITAVTLGLLARSFGLGARSDGRAELSLAAVRLAQSQLAAAGTIEPLTPGERRGDDGGRLVWRVIVDMVAVPDGGQSGIAAYRISAEVSERSGGAALVALRTMKLGPPP